MAAVDLTAPVGSLRLVSPVMTASGTSGHGAELASYFDLRRLGAVVVKSLAAEPWPGNPPPRVRPVACGMLNGVGLQGPGVAAWLEHDAPRLEATGAAVVASIWGRTVEDFARAAALLADAPACVVAVEVNVCCPNLEDRSKMFAHSPSATAEAVDAAAACRRPRWAKLSPNVSDIAEIAGAALGAGAEARHAREHAARHGDRPGGPPPGTRRGWRGSPARHSTPWPSGPCTTCRRAFPDASIIGVGGVSRGDDAVELLLAGADAVQVGTATFADPRAPLRILDELEQWCARHGVGTVRELVAAAHGREGRADGDPGGPDDGPAQMTGQPR